MPQPLPYTLDADRDALVAVLAARLQDAGTVLLAGAPVPAPLKRAFPSLPSILGQDRDSIAPCDRLPAPSAHQIEAAHDILTLAVALIGNPSHIRVRRLGRPSAPADTLAIPPRHGDCAGFRDQRWAAGVDQAECVARHRRRDVP